MSRPTRVRTAVFATVFALLLLPQGSAVAAPHKPRAQEWADSLRQVAVNGAQLACLDLGLGDPVILIHGISDDYRTWLGELEPLSQQYRVIAYSRRYHFPNAGGGDGRDYSMQLHERDLAALLDGLGLDSVHLIGHSSGAALAAQFAADYPDRVRSLVLAEPAFPELMTGSARDSQYVADRRVVNERAHQSLQNDFPALGLEVMVDWNFGEGALRLMPKAARQRMSDNALALKYQVLSPVKSTVFGRKQLEGIHCPVLYVEGAKSPWHQHAMGDAFIAGRPSTERVVLKNTSHGMVWDDPKAFSKVVLEFLDRTSLASE